MQKHKWFRLHDYVQSCCFALFTWCSSDPSPNQPTQRSQHVHQETRLLATNSKPRAKAHQISMPKTGETLRKTDLSQIISQSSNPSAGAHTKSILRESQLFGEGVSTTQPCRCSEHWWYFMMSWYVLYIFTQVPYKIRELTVNELICVERTFHVEPGSFIYNLQIRIYRTEPNHRSEA